MHQRLIVVANRTCPCPGLPDEVREHIDPSGRVYVVAPALNSRVRHWVTDADAAVRKAGARLSQAVGALREVGLDADGSVGDADPMHAIEDVLARFDADAVLISTWPEGHSNWLERDLVARAELALTMPVYHVVSLYGVTESRRGVRISAPRATR